MSKAHVRLAIPRRCSAAFLRCRLRRTQPSSAPEIPTEKSRPPLDRRASENLNRVGRRLCSHACDLNHRRDLHRADFRRPHQRHWGGGRRDLSGFSEFIECRKNQRAADVLDPKVPTRVNSPSDVELDFRDTTSGNLTFTTDVLNGAFTAANSVQPGGIHPKPGQTTGGNGPVTGEEVQFDVNFTTPFTLAAGHVFLRAAG